MLLYSPFREYKTSLQTVNRRWKWGTAGRPMGGMGTEGSGHIGISGTRQPSAVNFSSVVCRLTLKALPWRNAAACGMWHSIWATVPE
eukprot:2934107-Amphidinium_carterae.1